MEPLWSIVFPHLRLLWCSENPKHVHQLVSIPVFSFLHLLLPVDTSETTCVNLDFSFLTESNHLSLEMVFPRYEHYNPSWYLCTCNWLCLAHGLSKWRVLVHLGHRWELFYDICQNNRLRPYYSLAYYSACWLFWSVLVRTVSVTRKRKPTSKLT